jgi:mannose-1-phosphate guanylyltransferase/mannose-6-phosphate isomerase
VLRGLSEAERGAVVTFGILPDRPETGYGYIEVKVGAGDTAPGAAMDLRAFREKPDAATAATYVADGRHYWNSGIFMLRASVWLKAIGHFAPEILTACNAAVRTPTTMVISCGSMPTPSRRPRRIRSTMR